jgi:hypothetical protein
VTGQRETIAWRDVWRVIATSAERRLGRPLLLTYLALALVGLGAVVVSVVVMRL